MTNFVSCKVDKCRKCVLAPVFDIKIDISLQLNIYN